MTGARCVNHPEAAAVVFIGIGSDGNMLCQPCYDAWKIRDRAANP